MLNKKVWIKIFLIIWLAGAIFSFIVHLFYPNLISGLSLWNASEGWQREIALWNLGIILIITYNLIKNNYQNYKFIVVLLLIISLLLGINHLFGLIINKEVILINLLGAILNLIMVVFGGAILRNERDS